MDKVKEVEKKKHEPAAKQPEASPAEPSPAAEKEQVPAEDAEREALRAECEALKAEAEDLKRKWYAVSAEYENYRKRTAGDSARRYLEGRSDVVKGLFPIADNLERALQSCGDEATRKGIGMVQASFEALLKAEQIEPIDPLGKEFDAEECEAIMLADPSEGEVSGTVKQVCRKGYKQNGRVLRYAQVIVIK